MKKLLLLFLLPLPLFAQMSLEKVNDSTVNFYEYIVKTVQIDELVPQTDRGFILCPTGYLTQEIKYRKLIASYHLVNGEEVSESDLKQAHDIPGVIQKRELERKEKLSNFFITKTLEIKTSELIFQLGTNTFVNEIKISSKNSFPWFRVLIYIIIALTTLYGVVISDTKTGSVGRAIAATLIANIVILGVSFLLIFGYDIYWEVETKERVILWLGRQLLLLLATVLAYKLQAKRNRKLPTSGSGEKELFV